jgi:hypothetical protein
VIPKEDLDKLIEEIQAKLTALETKLPSQNRLDVEYEKGQMAAYQDAIAVIKIYEQKKESNFSLVNKEDMQTAKEFINGNAESQKLFDEFMGRDPANKKYYEEYILGHKSREEEGKRVRP